MGTEGHSGDTVTPVWAGGAWGHAVSSGAVEPWAAVGTLDRHGGSREGPGGRGEGGDSAQAGTAREHEHRDTLGGGRSHLKVSVRGRDRRAAGEGSVPVPGSSRVAVPVPFRHGAAGGAGAGGSPGAPQLLLQGGAGAPEGAQVPPRPLGFVPLARGRDQSLPSASLTGPRCSPRSPRCPPTSWRR